jgi:hypothetical protein
VTYRASSTANDGGTTSVNVITIPVPSAAQSGDAAVMAVLVNFTDAISSLSQTGWTQLGPYDESSTDRLILWTKTLTAGDITAADVDVTFAGNGRLIGGMSTFNIGAQSSPFGTPVGGVTNTTTQSSIATTQANSDIFQVQASVFGGTGQTPLVTFPHGSTDANPRTNFASGVNVGISLGHIAATSTGTYGGGIMPGASTATGYRSQAVLLEIKNAPAMGKLVVRRYNGTEWE